MKIYNCYFSEIPKEYIAFLEQCKWSAAKFFADIIKEKTYEKHLGEKPTAFFLLDGENIVSFCTLSQKDVIDDEKLDAVVIDSYTGKVLAEKNGLKVIEANINKSGENTTRFAVLSKVMANSPALGNSVLMFTVKNEVGSLANAISIIGKYGYNMTALRSRPMKKHSWQYYFYVEIDGDTDTENGRRMLEELSGVCDRLKVAGTFAPHTEI